MSKLYLIAHKVSGEPAFDVATRMECPECQGGKSFNYINCYECDGLGYWWIVPTSGHRAYPYNFAYYELEAMLPPCPEGMPDSLPDHYAHVASPTVVRQRLEDLIATLPPAKPIKRRF